jgi:YidC/Oxa1 family membrane protein insertase
LLDWLYTAISWVLLRWHDLFSTFLPKDGGLTWALSIMFLVITLRVLMFRFFVKQVKTQRAMQELQPKIQALRQKYKDDRQTMSREIMALQQEAGVNMLAGCLPILLQAPVFISLYHVLRIIKPGAPALYSWQQDEIASAANAKLFGAPIPAAFNYPTHEMEQLSGSVAATRVVAVVLIVCMVCATYFTQRMIMNRSVSNLDPQQAMIQRLMLYGMPASLAVSGFFFPIGILLYWFTNNLWTLGQQFYILKRMPVKTPTGAEKKPTVDPKVLAPKPGAKPLHPKNRRSQASAGADGAGPRTEQSAAAPGAAATDGPAGRGSDASGDGAPRSTPATPPVPRPSGTPSGAKGSGSAAGGAGGVAGAGGTNGSPAKRAPAKSGGNRPRSGKKRRR